jgi:hypothetical protein
MDSVPWIVVLVQSGGGGGGKFPVAIGVEVTGASGRGLDGVNRTGGTPKLARVLLRGNCLSPPAMANEPEQDCLNYRTRTIRLREGPKCEGLYVALR